MDTTVEYMIENGMSAKVSEKSKEWIFESISLFSFLWDLWGWFDFEIEDRNDMEIENFLEINLTTGN